MERTLKRDAPSWVWCDWCGTDDVEITTFPDNDNTEAVYDGDDLLCRGCGATSACGAEEGGAWVQDWNEPHREGARREDAP